MNAADQAMQTIAEHTILHPADYEAFFAELIRRPPSKKLCTAFARLRETIIMERRTGREAQREGREYEPVTNVA